ncbi:hypothetical protein KPL78_16015 [Roseomonas sp. HJA6]|uniref:Tripartite tricarboxylate transporter substrate binding protein n=1 Tax=Roseomonas alba TaxID=2846776 RepID=A0ABS7ADI4_9PROT|nr:hypothetical protein [Neoroseomonas alba]
MSTRPGYPGFERSEWYGFVGPAGLPPGVTARMNATILDALRQPGAVAKYRELDMATMPMTPAEFRTFLAEETERTTALVRAANITPQ